MCLHYVLNLAHDALVKPYSTKTGNFPLTGSLIMGWWEPEPLCRADTIASVILAQPPDAHIATHLSFLGKSLFAINVTQEHLGRYSTNTAKKSISTFNPSSTALEIVDQDWNIC